LAVNTKKARRTIKFAIVILLFSFLLTLAHALLFELFNELSRGISFEEASAEDYKRITDILVYYLMPVIILASNTYVSFSRNDRRNFYCLPTGGSVYAILVLTSMLEDFHFRLVTITLLGIIILSGNYFAFKQLLSSMKRKLI